MLPQHLGIRHLGITIGGGDFQYLYFAFSELSPNVEIQSVCMGLMHVPLNNVVSPRLLTWESYRSIKWLCSLHKAFLY